MQRLALGTAQFGLDYGVANSQGQMPASEVGRILIAARIAGLEILDTAMGYGSSEQVLGDFGIEDFHIVTKLPGLPIGLVDVDQWVEQQIVSSCERLRASGLYALLLHRPADLLSDKADALARSLKKLKENHVVQKVGVSIYDPEELTPIERILDIDLVQAPLNVIDRRLQTSGWLHRLREDGVEIHTRSAFLQGLLLMARSDMPEKFERWSSMWDQWQRYLKDTEISALSACLAYPLSLPEVDRVVVGVDSARQLDDILTAANSHNQSADTSFMTSSDTQLINPSKWSDL